MNEDRKSALRRAVITTMTMGTAAEASMDAADRAALEAALDTLSEFSGRAVGAAFLDWHRGGQIRIRPGRTINVVPGAETVQPRLPHINLNALGG